MRLLFASALTFFLALVQSAHGNIVIGFEELSLDPNSFYNGNNGSTNTLGWSSGGVYFGNSYNIGFGGFWNGFSYSNVKNTTTPGFANQYAAYSAPAPGAGAGGSNKYAVAYSGTHAFFNLPTNTHLSSVAVNNTTYAYLSMKNGDQFAKKFGGTTGNDPDFFRVTFSGYDSLNGSGNVIGTVTFTLADYTFTNNALDYIVDQWTTLNLSPIATARSVRLSWESSDVGLFGINTPTYLALDNLTIIAVPEPSSLALLGIAGMGIAMLRRRRSSQNH